MGLICDGDLIRLYGVEFPVRNETLSVGLDNRFLLTHSTSIFSARITSQSATDLFQLRGACPPPAQHYIFKGHYSPPTSSPPSEFMTVESLLGI